MRVLSCPRVWNCMRGELWKQGFFRRQGTLRVCSHYPPELACDLWLNPGVFDLGVSQPVCGLVRGLRPRHPLPVACGLCRPHRHWPRGPHPHAPTGPCHCALRPWYWVLLHTWMTASGQDITGGVSPHHDSWRTSFQSFTRDVQTTLCLDPLVVCYFSAWSRRGLVLMHSPSRSGYGSATRFQWCICRMVMRTTAPCTRFACRCILLVCIACMSASSVQRCSSGRWRHQAPATVPARMHCTSPSLPASSIPGPGASGLRIWP